jgi:DNA/RNA-binding domain of Phe-tRNA-synthetase-like protein
MSELGWRKDQEDQDDEDYVCVVAGQQVGRIYYHSTGGLIGRKWQWFFGASTGVTESRREAMLAVELAYEKSRDIKA